MSVKIDVSYGELADKITILEIKSVRIEDPIKRANVARELDLLSAAWAAVPMRTVAMEVDATRAALREVNEQLWDIEDAIRQKERDGEFDSKFVEIARSVYRTNDLRALHKRRIDELLGSALVEEKSYAPY